MNPTRLTLSFVFVLGLSACGDDVTRVTEVTGGGSGDPAAFNFRSNAPSEYVDMRTVMIMGAPVMQNFAKLDRMGGPATTTVLLSPGPAGGQRRQQANRTNPVDDAQYAAEYISTLRVIHSELATPLTSLGLTPCARPGPSGGVSDYDVGDCVTQAVSSNLNSPVIPDVLILDTRQPSVYPNGRGVDDPVVDLLLATALLDLTNATCLGGACTQTTFSGLPLNPERRGIPPVAPLANFPFFNNAALAPPPAATP